MALMAAAGVFLAVTFTVYGLFARPVNHGLVAERLGGLNARRGEQARSSPASAASSSFVQRVIAPLFGASGRGITRMMPTSMIDRLEATLERAGVKMSTAHFIAILGLTAGAVPIAGMAYMSALGVTGGPLLMTAGVLAGLGLYGPRVLVMGRIKRRQKAIWKELPDAFDLITASVEAGLGVDASFNRVLDRLHGPLGDELGRALREIQVGRSRKEAFVDMAERCGVEEFYSIINAIVQAENMGISIAGVVRQQTQMLRTKRRQRAEEQAFKAPIKMVFPLVFCIFPAIGIVIGGPAVIQLMQLLGE